MERGSDPGSNPGECKNGVLAGGWIVAAKKKITVKATVPVSVTHAWKVYTTPSDIMQWNHASDDWTCPRATVELKKGGRFVSRMEAKDKSAGFDFGGTYTAVKVNKLIAYRMDDGRKAIVRFAGKGARTVVRVTFEAESVFPPHFQRTGWQAILDNYKKHVLRA